MTRTWSCSLMSYIESTTNSVSVPSFQVLVMITGPETLKDQTLTLHHTHVHVRSHTHLGIDFALFCLPNSYILRNTAKQAMKCGAVSPASFLFIKWNLTLPWPKFQGYYIKEPATIFVLWLISLGEWKWVIMHWHSPQEHQVNLKKESKENCTHRTPWGPLSITTWSWAQGDLLSRYS